MRVIYPVLPVQVFAYICKEEPWHAELDPNTVQTTDRELVGTGTVC